MKYNAEYKGFAQLRGKTTKLPSHEVQKHESFFELVSPHLDGVSDFVGHAVAIAQANGDLARGEVSPQDIIDETLLRAYAQFLKKPAPRDMEKWLMHLAAKQVAAETLRSNSERKRVVHFEDDVSETPTAEDVSTLGAEILDFYQPDDALKLKDLLPDLDLPSPEEAAARHELLASVRVQLNALPPSWRRILLLHYIDGLNDRQLAEAVAMPTSEALHILKYAREYLRRKLKAAGCSFETRSSAFRTSH